MSETPTRFALEAADDLLLYPGRATLATIDKHLAAAEERGRRKGVEERDELRVCLELARGFVATQLARNPVPYNFETIQRIDAAIAPRDSGKEQT